jgi:ABC-type Fe3+/spermidine/putrescine transport system ATPase subunit
VDADQDRPLNDRSAAAIIGIRGVTKRYGDVVAVGDVRLDIGRGEFFCLLGPSGCGKTTLLRMIAGLDIPSAGQIFIDGQDMTDWPAWRRPSNMMFQSYALFPHLTVAGNVAFGLEEEGRPRDEIRARVQAALEMLDMANFAGRKPHQLSGGQRQRVALARALVKQPKILLLDEPLAALDKNLRERAQVELVRLRERLGITFVMVTHDQEEAMAMASRIALMQAGKIAQVGSPHELYEAPASRYVAGFFGEANFFEGPGGSATMVRPEDLRIGKTAPPGSGALRGRLESLVFLGSHYSARVTLDGGKSALLRLSEADLKAAGSPVEGEDVFVFWPREAARIVS